MFEQHTYSQRCTTRQKAVAAAFSTSTPPHVDYQLVTAFFYSIFTLQLPKTKSIRRLLRLLLAVAFFFQSIFSLQAQNTEGKEFWITFGQISDFSIAPDFDMQIRIVGGHETTTGKILFTDLGISHNFIVNPNQIYTYVLNNDEKIAVYNDR